MNDTARTHAFPIATLAGRGGGKSAMFMRRAAELYRDGQRVVVLDTCANGDACPVADSPFWTVMREWTPDGIGAPVLCSLCERLAER